MAKPMTESIRSDDGNVSFTLFHVADALFVERVQLHGGRHRTVHFTLFEDEPSFDSWCNSDPVRFDYPLVHVRLRRHGGRLLRRED
jgi:heme-degrading monooxygenase HmoA